MSYIRYMLVVTIGIGLIAISLSLACAGVIYVKWNSPYDGPGNDWDHGYHTIQAAIDAASAGTQIWVAKGTYLERITLKDGVELYGGFAGNEATLNPRYPATNVTTIYADADGTTVMIPGTVTSSARLDSFTITGGTGTPANVWPNPRQGGGIFCWGGSSVVITNNTIIGNTAISGAGIFCHTNCSPTITGNMVKQNTARNGGGIFVTEASPSISGNVIDSNSAGLGAGIFCNGDGRPLISGNTIQNNIASDPSALNYGGGGICCLEIEGRYGRPTIANNLILSNYSDDQGGGVFCWEACMDLTNNTIARNYALKGGGIAFQGATHVANVSNNIVALNSNGIFGQLTNTALRNNDCYNPEVLGYTPYDYEGVTPGTGDIQVDPKFQDALIGIYSLRADSPCKDTGWNSAPGIQPFDRNGYGRIYNGTVDMGAFEFWPVDMDIPNAKNAPDGARVFGSSAIVSAAFKDYFYIESPDRQSGIRVDMLGHGFIPGMKVSISSAQMATNDNGERYIAATTIAPSGSGNVNPLCMSTRTLGGANSPSYDQTSGKGQVGVKDGAGLNNIGLFVTISGRITQVAYGANFLYVDDGSMLRDGTYLGDNENIGVRVEYYPVDAFVAGDDVIIQGISSCFKPGGTDVHRLVRAISVRYATNPPALAAMTISRPDAVPNYGDSTNLLMWDDLPGIPKAGIVEYHIWRNIGPVPVLAPSPTVTPWKAFPGYSYLHGVEDYAGARTFSYMYPSSNHGLAEAEVTDSGPTYGNVSSYRLSVLYRYNVNGVVTYWETEPVYLGTTTLLVRPVSVSPTSPDAAGLSDITFEWEGSRGANTYQIEVSTTPSFVRDQTWVSRVTALTSTDGQPISRSFAGVLNSSPELSSVSPGTTLYWRVGARNSADRPGPYPAGPSPQVDGAKNTRFTYGDVAAFTVAP